MNAIARRSPLARALSAVALIPVAAAAAIGLGIGVVAVLGRAFSLSSPLLVLGGGLAAVAIGTWLLMLPVGEYGWPARRNPLATLVMFLTVFGCLAGGVWAYVQPLPTASRPLASSYGGFWTLPSGAKVAYYRATVNVPRADPILVLHDGPGSPDGQLSGALAELSSTGRDVYAFDQPGTGLSSRLADVRGYTLRRAVEDLEAIREELGSERMVLQGTGWGATLAAQYTATHPNRVAALALTSPAPLAHQAIADPERERALSGDAKARAAALQRNPRVAVARMLAAIAPRVAPRIVEDDDLDGWASALVEAEAPAGVCRGKATPTPLLPVAGGYARIATESRRDAASVPDPVPALRKVRVPTLILRGTCDYVAWAAARAYRDTIPGALLVNLPGEGHDVGTSAPDDEARLIRAFLTGDDLARQPYREDADPSER